MKNIEVIKTPEEVNIRVKEMGAEITRAYGSEPLTMLVVMNGGLFFAAKLAEAKLRRALIRKNVAEQYKG